MNLTKTQRVVDWFHSNKCNQLNYMIKIDNKWFVIYPLRIKES